MFEKLCHIPFHAFKDTYGSSFDIVHVHPKINVFTLYFTHSVVHICKAEDKV